MSEFRVALIGCGRIATRKHAVLLGKDMVDGAELVAVCDIIEERAEALGDEYGVPWYTDMEELAIVEQPDIIAILTPSGMHAGHLLRLVTLSRAHFVVEKPIALTLTDAQAMVDACETAGVKLTVVKQNRYNVAVQHAREVFDEVKLGRLFMGTVRVRWKRDRSYYRDWHGTWAQAGGVLANQAIHHVDLLQWFLGPARRVSAFVLHYASYAEVEVGLVATLEFVSGAIGTIEATTLAQPCDLEGSLSLLGDKGTIELGGFAVNKITRWRFTDGTCYPPTMGENPPTVYGYGHLEFYNDLVRSLRDGREPPVTGREAMKSLEIVTAIYEAMETGRVVEVGGDYGHVRLGRETKPIKSGGTFVMPRGPIEVWCDDDDG